MKYWGICMALAISIQLTGCKETPKTETLEIAQIPVEPVIQKVYGFNKEDFTIVHDTVKNGDSFGQLMLQNHVDYPKIVKISDKYKDSFDVKRIKVGRPYTILKSKDSLEKAEIFIYENDKINFTVVDLRDSVTAYKSKKKVTYKQREVAGEIQGSLSMSLDSLGVDYLVTIDLSEIYAWTIDFFRLEKGDRFKILFKERYINDSIYAGVEPIEAALFEHKGKQIYAFPFVTDSLNQVSDFFDLDGNNLRSTFLKAPIKFGYRLSSRFNLKRRIAYYGYKVRPHRGTDYAAPIGTPIVATADGTVTESTRRGGNGKYVKIKHNGMYSTQYLHMRKQAVRRGDFVRQGDVIGWVGMTGNTGGPHVCYRFWKNGVQVDPLREKLPSAEPLADSLRPRFNEFIKPIKQQLDCIEFPKRDKPKTDNLLTLN